ncbi:hypothetical protein HanIR_Chr03g0110551 [Helianthus annuus]|nr:hypothetical protein HanIR_Chr03g0110551 [Helianthus annuus]
MSLGMAIIKSDFALSSPATSSLSSSLQSISLLGAREAGIAGSWSVAGIAGISVIGICGPSFNGSKQSSVMTIKEINHPDFPLGVFLPDQSRRF